MGNTWGISGPLFLGLYGGALAAVFGAIWLIRRRMAGPEPSSSGLQRHSYELAMLNGGEELAVAAAMTSLRLSGLIEAGDGALRVYDAKTLQKRRSDLSSPLRVATLEPPRFGHPVESAVYEAVRGSSGQGPSAVRERAARAPALTHLRQQLVQQRLLFSDEQRSAMRLHALLYVPLLALGLVRLGFGISRDRPVGFLLVLLVLTVLAAGLALKVPTHTPHGDRALSEAQSFQSALKADAHKGSLPSAWLVTAMALFGTAALWQSDPHLAAALGLPSQWTGAGGGGFWAGGGGGCGGGGCGGGGCGG